MLQPSSPIQDRPNAAAAVQVSYPKAVMVLASCLLFSAPAWADVYQYIAADGTHHFSDQPTDSRYRLLMRTEGNSTAVPRKKQTLNGNGNSYNKQHFELVVTAAAVVNRIDAELLHAVIHTESGYNPKAVSPKGAQGLMQLMPATARHYGVTDPFDAAQNVGGGARHLRELLNQFSNNKELALAAYNAGAGAVIAHGRRIPPYKETTLYVPKVLLRYEALLGK